MTLTHEIMKWDRKDATYIKRVYAIHHQQDGFLESLLSLFPSIDHQDGATWLFKHAIDQRDLIPEAIDPSLIEAMCTALESLENWAAQLHVLQILSVVPIPRSCAESVESFARTCNASKKTLVRAWSYSALFAATAHDPREHARTIELLETALSDDSAPASVKARIRNTLKS